MAFSRDLDFYTIIPSEIDFPKVMAAIHALQDNDSSTGKILTGGGYSIALTELVNSADSCEGIIVRLRTSDLPLKGNLVTHDFKELGLAKGEGLAEMTFFFYYKPLKILCLLPAKNGVKCGTFAWYINEKSDIDDDINLEMLLSVDALKVFRSWKSITSVLAEVKIGSDSGPDSTAVKTLPLGIVLDETKRVGAARIKVELYNPKRKRGLVVKVAKQIGDAFRSLGGHLEPEHIKVKGSQGAEYADSMIDLISQRFRLPVRLGKSKDQYLEFDECRSIVRKKIIDNQNTLKESLGVKDE